MKIAIIILVVIVVLLALVFIVIRAISSPISKEEGNMAIEKSLQKFVDKHNEVDNVILRLYSDSGGYDEVFVVDSRDMLYDESKDLYIIMNVGVQDLMEECVSQLIKVLMVYNRIQ